MIDRPEIIIKVIIHTFYPFGNIFTIIFVSVSLGEQTQMHLVPSEFEDLSFFAESSRRRCRILRQREVILRPRTFRSVVPIQDGICASFFNGGQKCWTAEGEIVTCLKMVHLLLRSCFMAKQVNSPPMIPPVISPGELPPVHVTCREGLVGLVLGLSCH